MKNVSRRWLRAILFSLFLTGPTWAQAVVFPDGPSLDDPHDEEATVSLAGDAGFVKIYDEEASVQLGQYSSGSATFVDQAPVQFPPAPAYRQLTPEQVMGSPQPTFQQAMMPEDPSVGFASMANLDRILWRVGGTTMDQYGIRGGYTNLNAFVPLYIESDTALWWANPRVNITDYGEGGANLGFGRRVYVPGDDRVYGASFWWDYDNGHRGDYHRLGGSFESIGQYVSLRGNFALVTGDTMTDFGMTTGDATFVGNQIALPITYWTERAFNEYDVEVTAPLPVLGRYGFDMGLGMYLLTAEGLSETTGVSVRTQAQITENFWLNGIYTYDRIFDSNFSLNFEWTVPDGMPSRWFRRKPVSEALTASAVRRYRVPVANVNRTESALVTDSNGDALNIAFIDPNRTASGDGSRGNPFMSIADYMGVPAADRSMFDVIFVNRRNDPTQDTNLNTTITLLDSQRLIGNGTLPDGSRPTINGFVNGNQFTVGLPVDPGALPRLTNSGALGSNVVTLANGNTVAGFDISAGGTAAGIFGNNIQGFDINNNMFSNVVDGIRITSNTTLDPTITNAGIIRNNMMTGSGAGGNSGVTLTHTAGTLDLLFADNEISGFRSTSGPTSGIGARVVATGGTINALDSTTNPGSGGFYNNVIVQNGTGLQLESTGAGTEFNADVFSNNESVLIGEVTYEGISSNTNPNGAGFVALADNNSTMNLNRLTSNLFKDNEGDGVQLRARNNGTLNAPVIQGNTMSGNQDNGIEVLADNAVVTAVIGEVGAGNLITDNGRVETRATSTSVLGSGVLLTTLNNGEVYGGINGNSITFNAESGVKIAPDSGLVDLTSLTGNSITQNGYDEGLPIPTSLGGGDAIVFAPSNGATFSVGQFDQNIISGNRGATIRVGGNGGIVDLGVIENTIFDRTTAGTAGIIFDADNSTISGVIRNNMFVGSEANSDLSFGIGGEIRGGTLDLVVQDNIFDTNAEAAIGLIFGVTDDRTAPGTGTPIIGDAAEASLVIVGNQIINTFNSSDDRFDGSAISLHMRGYENNALTDQNDLDGDGIPDAPAYPSPDGSDDTNLIMNPVLLEAVIAGNIIGVTDINGDGIVDLNSSAAGNAGAGIDIQISGDAKIGDRVSTLADIPATLSGLTIGTRPDMPYGRNIIVANSGDGIRVLREDNAIIDDFRIAENVIQNNLRDGINIRGVNNGIPYGIQEVLNFDILNNQIIGNGFLLTDGDPTQSQFGRGIQLRADGGVILEANIAGNVIHGNRLSGIEARTFTNTHILNPLDGGVGSIPSARGGDQGIIFGNWEQNTITNNGFFQGPQEFDEEGNPLPREILRDGHGIALGRIDRRDPSSQATIVEGFNNGGVLLPDQDGDGIPDHPELTIRDNLISGNSLDGVHVYLDKFPTFSVSAQENRTSRINVLNNDITKNGDDGINIHSPRTSMSIFNVHNNLISENGAYSGEYQYNQAGDNVVSVIGDGIEIVTGGLSETIINASNNRIIDNAGRGVNALNGGSNRYGSGYLSMNFDRNNISSNVREGFYLVNAPLMAEVNYIDGSAQGTARSGYSADTWLADFDSNHELFNYGHGTGGGSFTADNDPPAKLAPFLDAAGQNIFSNAPVTDLVFTSNIVDNNGSVQQSADAGKQPYNTFGGLVIRLGTATADQSVPDGVPSVPVKGQVGGVRALVTDNRMSGNMGADVYFDGFVATNPPNVSIVPDPLLRFDLVFENNRGGSLDVGAGNFSVYYTNTAPALPPGNLKRPNPPYVNQAVPRDAWRNIGDNGSGMMLPGFGDPTLRIEMAGAAPNAFGNWIGNNNFNLIYSDFNPFYWLSSPDGSLLPTPPAGPFPPGY